MFQEQNVGTNEWNISKDICMNGKCKICYMFIVPFINFCLCRNLKTMNYLKVLIILKKINQRVYWGNSSKIIVLFSVIS